MDKKIRMIAGAIITESKLSSSSKKQLLQFVKEQATDSQVKALLLDGEIVKLDEQSEQIVNKRFESFSINKGWIKTILRMAG